MAITMPAAQRAVWDRMLAESHPWLSVLKGKADKDGTSSPAYSSRGRWSALYFLITGDLAYARRCYDYLGTTNGNWLTPTRPGNDTREHCIEQVLILDWIRPALTPTEQETFRHWLTLTADGIFAKGLRRVDSDEVCGTYGFFAVLDTVCGTDYLTRSIKDPTTNALIPLGGLTATAADRSTIRNCLHQFIAVLSAGGQWCESQEYNLGTPQLVYLTWVGLKTALGVDHLPEFAAWLPLARLYHRHELLPPLKGSPFQWGDCDTPRSMDWASRDDLYAFLRVGDPAFEQFATDVDLACGRTLPTSQTPLYPRWFYYADPYAAAAPWRADTPTLHVTSGTGHAYWRTGFSAPDRATHLMCPVSGAGTYVDHYPNVFGDLRIVRGSVFLLDHPISYTPPHTIPNALLVANSPPSREAGALTASAHEPGVVAYAAGTNCGKSWDVTSNYYPPPTYLHENTRSVVELLDGPETLLVIFDRVFADDPRTQLTSTGGSALTRYPAATQTRMKAALGLIDLLWHTPVAPEVAERSFSWRVPNTSWTVRVEQVLTPGALTYTVVDESNPALDVAAGERKWCVHGVARPAETLPCFDVFLHVLTASEGPTAVTTTPALMETECEVRGVLITRPDRPDVAVCFSTRPGPIVTIDHADVTVVARARLLTATFSVTLPRPAVVYLADLDPAVVWYASVDGHANATITRSGDLLTLETDRAGALTLWANEPPPAPPIPEWRISEQSATRIVLER